MPQISSDSIESVQATEEVIKQHCANDMRSPVKRYELFKALKKSFKFDERSRIVAFEQNIINSRRESVVKMFFEEGKSYDQIAKALQVSENVVRNDINWYRENKKQISVMHV